MRKQFEISLSRISIMFLCTIVSSNFQDKIELPNYTRTIECEILSQVLTSVTPDLRYDSHENEKKAHILKREIRTVTTHYAYIGIKIHEEFNLTGERGNRRIE